MIEVDEDILFYAFRYALGRRTYAVSDVVRALVSVEHKLSWKTKEQIANEIGYAHSIDKLGDECDKELWLEIRKQFTHQPHKDT